MELRYHLSDSCLRRSGKNHFSFQKKNSKFSSTTKSLSDSETDFSILQNKSFLGLNFTSLFVWTSFVQLLYTISSQFWSTLIDILQMRLKHICSIMCKLNLLFCQTLSLTPPASQAFSFPNNAASYLFVNILFSYKYVYQSIVSSLIKLT